jgi:hypothetical protein
MNHREAGPALAAIPARTRPRARTTGEDCVHGGSAGRGGPCGHAQRCGAPGGRDISEHSHLVARADEHGVDGPTLDPASCVCTEGSSSLMRVDGGGTARKLRCAAHLERQLCDMQLQMLNGRSWPDSDQWRKSGRAFADNGRDATPTGPSQRKSHCHIADTGLWNSATCAGAGRSSDRCHGCHYRRSSGLVVWRISWWTWV